MFSKFKKPKSIELLITCIECEKECVEDCSICKEIDQSLTSITPRPISRKPFSNDTSVNVIATYDYEDRKKMQNLIKSIFDNNENKIYKIDVNKIK